MEKVEEALITSKEKEIQEENDLKDRNEKAKLSFYWSVFYVITTLSIYQLLYMNWMYLPPVPEIDDSVSVISVIHILIILLKMHNISRIQRNLIPKMPRIT